MDATFLTAVATVVGSACVFAAAVHRPRLVLYLIIATCPTQFVFIPVSNFFISPADVLVLAAAAAFVLRLAAGSRSSLVAIWKHRYLFLMVAVYATGFLILGLFSRTIVRVLMAMVPSVLAYELLRSRVHLRNATAALVFAGVLDASYGVALSVAGRPIDSVRFSGMSGLNFSATVILTASAIMFGRRALARHWTSLAKPGALAAIGVATLSQGGIFAFLVSWVVLLRRAVSRRNLLRVALTVVVLCAIAVSSAAVRERLASRNRRTVENDGVARNSADVRLNILRVAWIAFASSPTWGIGYSQFQSFSLTDPDILKSTGGQGYGTHNTYVEILVEGGIAAFLCFVLHFSQFLSGLRDALVDLVERKDSVAVSALVGVPLVLAAAALTNALLIYHFWAVCGLGLSCVRVVRQSRQVAIRQPPRALAATRIAAADA
jgi:O-antigen ligase